MQINGAHDWNRTNDLLLTKEVLYRLSYVGGAAFTGAEALNGAGDGNRTRTNGLEGRSSTIELLPPLLEHFYRPSLVRRSTLRPRGTRQIWWREVDSNHRRHKPADLQSAPVGRLGIPPANEPAILAASPVGVNDQSQTLKRKCRTSPSRTTYSLPSRRSRPASRAPDSPR